MRPGQHNKRGRNRNRRHSGGGGNSSGGNPLNRVYESNGPDVKVRGTAQTVADKYLQLGRDAMASGDIVMSESYFQHAEHYQRILAAAQAYNQQFQQQTRRPNGEDGDDDDDGDYAGEGEGDDTQPPCSSARPSSRCTLKPIRMRPLSRVSAPRSSLKGSRISGGGIAAATDLGRASIITARDRSRIAKAKIRPLSTAMKKSSHVPSLPQPQLTLAKRVRAAAGRLHPS